MVFLSKIKGVCIQWHYLKPMTSDEYSTEHVTPANAGVQNGAPLLGPGFRRDDAFLPAVLATAC